MATVGVFAALLLVLFLLRWVYSRYCLHGLDVRLYLSTEIATQGDTVTLTEELTNSKWLPLPWVGVKFRTGRELKFASTQVAADAYYRNDLYHILMYQKITRRLPFECARRGYYVIEGLEITGWDVLMENKFIKQFTCDARLTVLPRTIPTPELEQLCALVYGQLATASPINPDPFTFRGIREYTPADPLKAINFKVSARAQAMMVNMWEFCNERQVVILLDTKRHAVWHNPDLEERAISIAASVSEKMLNAGAPVGFAANGRSILHGKALELPQGIGGQQQQAILENLALIDLENQALAPIALHLEEAVLHGVHQPEYWLISAYFSYELARAYTQAVQTGLRVAWVMPGERPVASDFCDSIVFV